MIIVLFLVCVVFLIIGAIAWNSCDDAISILASLIGIFGAAACIIAAIFFGFNLVEVKTLDSKIEMFQTENAVIESQIAECVEQYQKYETEIFTEVKGESAITLVTLYPELKADQLISKQIEVYVANNEKIRDLKEQKINGDIYRWWLYFGKGGEG